MGAPLLEPGGWLRAGDREGSFDVIARNDTCQAEARARIQVVAALDVQPREGRVEMGGTFRLTIRGGAGTSHARLLDDARGATLGDDGVFTAPSHEGRWQALVTDSQSRREVVVGIDVVKKLAGFRSRSSIVAVPASGRAPLAWSGGSGSFDVTVSPANGGRIESDPIGALLLALEPDAPTSLVVRAVHRVTHEEAHVRVVVAPPLGSGGDHAGLTVALVRVGAATDAFVADTQARADRRRIERFELSAQGTARKVAGLDDARLGASAPVAVDFDGDGVPEIAIADPGAWPQRLAVGEIHPDGFSSDRTSRAWGAA